MTHRRESAGVARVAGLARTLVLGLAVLFAGCGGDSGSGPTVDPPSDTLPPPPSGNHTFRYGPPDGAPSISTLAVRGSFNDWGTTPMARGEDGLWRASVDLPDGETQYKFFVNGGWIDDMCYDETWGAPVNGWVVDPEARGCVSDGFTGRNAVVYRGTEPVEFVHEPAAVRDVSGVGDALSIRFQARAGTVSSAVLVHGGDTVPMYRQFTRGLTDVWRVSADVTGSYSIAVESSEGARSFGPWSPPAEPFRAVPWLADAVGYQIFPDRFWNGDPSNDSLALGSDEYDFLGEGVAGTPPTLAPWDGVPTQSHCCHQYFGGDLQGVIDRLPELEARGVSVLYLNPIWEAGSAHGYDGFDFRRVAANLGDSTVLRSLVDGAHARGMKLIWDFVPNHVGIGHWAFQDAIANGRSSDYWEWFDFRVDPDSVQAGNGNHYAGWWGFGSLPELQTGRSDVFDHLIAIARDWTAFGLDGIRVDVPQDIHNRSTFFPAMRAAARAENPEVYLLGEIWEQDPSWLRGNQFDALMNYALGQGMVAGFARGDISGPVAVQRLVSQYATYPEASAAMAFNLIASHDTDRLGTLLSGEGWPGTVSAPTAARQRLAAAVLYALPGMPVTFQGDECGFTGGADGLHLARYPVQWDDCDTAMRDHWDLLGALKRSTPALASSVVRDLPTSGPLLAFYRGEPGPGEVLALFHNGASAVTTQLPDGEWTDLATGAGVSGTVSVESLGWRLLERR